MPEEPSETDTTEDTVDQPDTGDSTDLASALADLDKWKKQSRRHEERAKANAAAAAELEKLRESTMNETEKAVAQARAEAAREAATQFGGRLVAAEVRVAAAGRDVDVDALMEGIDPTRFLGDDGDPDTDAIKAWVERIAPPKATTDDTPNPLDLGQGNRGGTPPALNSTQLERDLKSALGIG